MNKNNTFDLSEEYPLTTEQIRSYQANGHIYLPHLMPESQISYYREQIIAAVKKYNTEKRDLKDRDTYGKAFLQIFNLWRKNEILKNFVLAKRFGQVAARLMGVEKVRLYHDQALFKEAGGGHTPWHQDQFYWPLDTHNTITMWMPLIDLTKEMGIMQFVSGSHEKGFILSKEISDDSDEFFARYIEENDMKIVGQDKVTAGDATFHSGWTLHNAPPNQTDKMREVMTIIYYADKTRVLEPDNSYRENDRQTWLGGLAPGQEANSDLNPLV